MLIGQATLRDSDETSPAVLRVTPSEWRRLLEERSFLDHPDNRYQPPRRYCGRPVQVVPAQPHGS
jgi:hypothetical protein